MKKVLSILVLALVAVQFAFAGDVITQGYQAASADGTQLYQPVFLETAHFTHQD